MKKIIMELSIILLVTFTLGGCGFSVAQNIQSEDISEETTNSTSLNDQRKLPDGAIAVDEENFPDKCFIKYVEENIDNNKDYVLDREERDNVKGIYLTAIHEDEYLKNVRDVSGIEYFENLEELQCYEKPIDEIDVSKNLYLKELMVYDTKIKKLDVSKNSKLLKLICAKTYISSIDLSKNPELTYLNCSETKIDKIDISSNKKLEYVDVSGTYISDIDVSGNPNLEQLGVSDTGIKEIDVSGCGNLMLLALDNTVINNVDISQNEKLEVLFFSGCKNLKNIDISNNHKLSWITLEKSGIKNLDLTGFTEISEVKCDEDTEIIGVDEDVIKRWYSRKTCTA